MSLSKTVPIFCFFCAITIPASAGFVEDPSFEFNYNEEWPHYGPVDAWAGASGTNLADGPFHNANTPIPDGFQVGFKQGGGTVSQDIFDLEAGKQYFVQFFYDARGCCGGTVDLSTEIDGNELNRIVNVQPSTDGDPYKFRSVAFTPESDTITLGFTTTTSGDATALIDAVSIVQRDEGNIPLQNPSFEASGTPEGNGVMEEFLVGWEAVGTFGVNKSGDDFADNGSTTDQDHVGFINGVGSLAQTVSNVVDESTYNLTFSYNAGDEGTAHLVVTSGLQTLLDEDVTPVGGNNTYRTKTIEFQSEGDAFDVKFAQTNPGAVVLLDDIKLEGASGVSFPPLVTGPPFSIIAPGQRTEVSVTVSAARLAQSSATIKVRIGQFEVAEIVGADFDGELALEFAADGDLDVTKTFEAEGIDSGSITIEFTDTDGLELNSAVAIEVATSLLRNASFEAGDLPGGVGYGPILGWEAGGGTGINNIDQPFRDNGIVPDRERVALLQGSTNLSQDVLGLTVGETYWLQFYYNVRNCCGGTIDLAVNLGESELALIQDIQPAGPDEPFHFMNVVFTATAKTALIQFSTTAEGDATALLDAITIVPRPATDVLVKNPSFEPSAPAPGVGYLGPNPIAGWEMSGGYGVNGDGVGPFTDNGLSEAGGAVLFIQGAGAATQLIEGLNPGTDYTLSYKINRRACCSEDIQMYEVTIDDELVFDEEIEAAGVGSPFWERSIDFTPDADAAQISFRNVPSGDQTLLLDDVRVFAKDGGGPVDPGFSVPLEISIIAGNTARISWPRDAPDAVLQWSSDLVTWEFVEALPFVDGDDLVVADVINAPARYYRLLED
jgi:hypothetical protein